MESKIHGTEHSYFEIKRLISSLVARYPFIRQQSIGKSAAGRDIPVIFLGEEKDFTLFIAGDDGRCRITTLILLKFIKELLDKILSSEQMCGINIRKAMFGRGIAILPLLNPDGFEIAGRGEKGCGNYGSRIARLCGGDYKKWGANLRGVELKRNFFYGFEARRENERQNNICGPRCEGFGGYRPESEPETAALAQFCRTHDVRQIINLTGVGQTVTYGNMPILPKRSTKMAEVMAAVTSFSVTPPIAMDEPELCHWFTYEHQKPAITVKIGSRSAPDCSELTYWYARLREMLTLSCLF